MRRHQVAGHRLRHRCLADAARAHHAEEPMGEHFVRKVADRRLAPVDRGGTRGQDRQIDRRGGGSRHWQCQAIAAPWLVDDGIVVRAGLGQRLARGGEVDAQGALLDRLPRPDPVEQSLPRHQPAACLDQHGEQVDRAGAQPHRLVTARQHHRARIEGERPDADAFDRRYVHKRVPDAGLIAGRRPDAAAGAPRTRIRAHRSEPARSPPCAPPRSTCRWPAPSRCPSAWMSPMA